MTTIHKTTRAAYRAGEFTNFDIRTEDDGSALVYRNGKFVQLFASRLVAEREIAAAQAKAAKFIQ
jgi:hypothetical protein